MNRRHGSLVTRVHRLQHVQGLGSTHLADNDAIRTHAQAVAKQAALRHLALALDVGRARLEDDHVFLLKLQFCGIFDRHDPLFFGNPFRQDIQQRGLPRTRSARNQNIQLAANTSLQELDHFLGNRFHFD